MRALRFNTSLVHDIHTDELYIQITCTNLTVVISNNIYFVLVTVTRVLCEYVESHKLTCVSCSHLPIWINVAPIMKCGTILFGIIESCLWLHVYTYYYARNIYYKGMIHKDYQTVYIYYRPLYVVLWFSASRMFVFVQ